jgi:hypothetical protein
MPDITSCAHRYSAAPTTQQTTRGAVADDNFDARTLPDGARVGIPYLT